MKKSLLGILVLVFVVAVGVSGVAAQAGAGDSPIATPTAVSGGQPPVVIDPESIPELPGLLALLAGPQGWVMLGVLLSLLLAKWPWYNAQVSNVKQGVFLALTAGVSLVAYLLVTYVPVAFWAASAPFWTIIAGVVMTWMGGSGTYLLGVKPYKRTWLAVDGEDGETR